MSTFFPLVFEFEWRTTYFGISLRVEVILGTSWYAKMSSTLNETNRFTIFLVKISTLRRIVHQNLTEHGRCHMQNNQLSMKSHAKLENNSIIRWNSGIKVPMTCVKNPVKTISNNKDMWIKFLKHTSRAILVHNMTSKLPFHKSIQHITDDNFPKQ